MLVPLSVAFYCWVFVTNNVQSRSVVRRMIMVRYYTPYYSKISTNDYGFYAAK
jgi:hypothetical protein